MAASGTRLVFFLITIHTLLWYAGVAGWAPYQTQNNPHQQFVDNVQTKTQAGLSDLNRSRTGRVQLTGRTLGFVDIITGILTSPYNWMLNAPIHVVFKTILSAMLAFAEIAVVVSFLRGVDMF